MLCNVKCYGSTGFNAVNRPLNAKQLLALSDIPVFYEDTLNINTLILPTIRIKLEFFTAQYIDYIEMTHGVNSYYYVVTNLKMLNDNVCELSLLLDGWNSCNDGNEIALDGSVERMHIKKSDDIYGKYSLDEEFTPSEPLRIAISDKIGQTIGAVYDVVEFVQQVTQQDKNKAQVMSPSEATPNDEVLLIPSISKSKSTNIVTGSATITTGISGLYSRGANPTKVDEQINLLRQYGMENAILSSYDLPIQYVDLENVDGATGHIQTIKPKKLEFTNPLNLYYASVNNQKALYGKYNTIKLLSNCSGESIEFHPEDVAVNGQLTITITCDPRSTGKPVASFKYYKGTDVSNLLLNSVNGENWANTPILFTDKSGSAVDRLNFNTNQAVTVENARLKGEQQMIANVVGGAVSGAGNGVSPTSMLVGGIAGGVKAGLVTAFNAHYENQILKNTLEAEKEIFTRNLTYTQPQVSFAKSQALRDYVGNSFYVIQNRLSVADIINYDTYLTRYGYNVGNVDFNLSYLDNRKNFVFLKFNDLNIRNNKSIYIRNQAVAELKNGIRLWKVRPNSVYMKADGNNE